MLADKVGGGTTAGTGTSASAAVVAGAAALLVANDPSASNGVLVGRLARTADAAGTVAQTGNGRVTWPGRWPTRRRPRSCQRARHRSVAAAPSWAQLPCFGGGNVVIHLK